MMKSLNAGSLLSAALSAAGCTAAPEGELKAAQPWIAIEQNESILPFAQGILASDFGAAGAPGEGFIQYLERGFNFYAVPPGILTKPTAMACYKNYLLVTENSRLVGFDLNEGSERPAFVIAFPQDEHYLNDILVYNGALWLSSVQNDRLYRILLPEGPLSPAAAAALKPEFFASVPGPNGITAAGSTIYAVSIPHDYRSLSAENVIYAIDLKSSQVKPLVNRPGLYDGAAVFEDKLYVSDWQSSSIEVMDLKDGSFKTFFHKEGMTPADIAIDPRYAVLYIPDMLNKRILTVNLRDGRELDYLPRPLEAPLPYSSLDE